MDSESDCSSNRSTTSATGEPFSFECRLTTTVQELQSLERNIGDPSEFTIWWDTRELVHCEDADRDLLIERLVDALIELFQYFGTNGILWCRLCINFNVFESTLLFLPPLLGIANRHSLFQKIHIASRSIERENTENVFFFPEITMNDRLESLNFMADRCSMTRGDYEALSTLLHTSQKLQDLGLSTLVTDMGLEFICQGLSNSNALKMFGFSCDDLSDVQFTSIISSLQGHCSLRLLSLNSPGSFGGSSSLALQSLLTSLSSLTSFVWEDIYIEQRSQAAETPNMDAIFQGIAQNPSLQYISLGTENDNFGDFMFHRILDTARLCPVLEKVSLGLSYHGNVNMNKNIMDLETVKATKRTTKPITLEMCAPIPEGNILETYMEVLRCHPELRLYFSASHLRSHPHIFNLNWHGRYLLDRPNEPLSLWPLVLEDANSKPAVLYDFLHGPSFAGRLCLTTGKRKFSTLEE